MADAPTSYFRYDEVLIGEGYTDQCGEYVRTGSRVKLQLHEYRVLKETPRGVRIDDYSDGGRFISRDWHKQWACPTVEEARQSYIARKRRQVRILEARLATAREAMGLAELGHCPTEVGWLVPRPPWARGSDPSAQAAKDAARSFELKALQDWASG